MGFLELVTLILLLLKAFGVISISWWLVFLPVMIAIVGYIGIIMLYFLFGMSIISIFKR